MGIGNELKGKRISLINISNDEKNDKYNEYISDYISIKIRNNNSLQISVFDY